MTALIFAMTLDGKGGATSGTDTSNHSDSSVWMHFDANDADAIDAIKNAAPDIDDTAITALMNEDARPRAVQIGSGVLIILRGINHNQGEEAEDMVAVRMWFTEGRIISLRYRKSKALMEVAQKLENGQGPLSIGDVFTEICTTLFGFIEIKIDDLYERLDQIESRVIDQPDKDLRRDISEIRKAAILLRRYVSPQKEAINQLRYMRLNWLSAENLRQIQEAYDSILRTTEDLDAIRERAQVVKDELINALSDKLNRNMYVLSVITAVFLPLGFLTGLFGINIGGMPGVESNVAFAVFTSTLVIIILIQVVLFRWFKWF